MNPWLLSTGRSLPPAQSTTSAALAAGIDINTYHGWPVHLVASQDAHPSQLGAAALSEAVSAAGLEPRDLDLILSTGTTRDYLGSWSVATEIGARIGARCVGIDLMLGCLGLLAGMEVARGWLSDSRYRFVAVVAAERWTYTIDRTDRASMPLWGHSDGAAAIILGIEPTSRCIGQFRGATFVARHELNGFIRVTYGGTREPIAPPGCNPFTRSMRGDAAREMFPKYLDALAEAVDGISSHVGVRVEQMVCNQISPNVVSAIEARCGLPSGTIPRTGERHGHVGGADLVLGLSELHARSGARGPVVVASSCPYAFAAGVITTSEAGGQPG